MNTVTILNTTRTIDTTKPITVTTQGGHVETFTTYEAASAYLRAHGGTLAYRVKK